MFINTLPFMLASVLKVQNCLRFMFLSLHAVVFLTNFNVFQLHQHKKKHDIEDDLRAEIQDLKRQLAETQRCLSATRRENNDLRYFSMLCSPYCIDMPVLIYLSTPCCGNI
jgi:uncharacterized protein YlxW (UPF0749 family)